MFDEEDGEENQLWARQGVHSVRRLAPAGFDGQLLHGKQSSRLIPS